MNWKQRAVKKLKDYPALCNARENLQQELTQITPQQACYGELVCALERTQFVTHQVEKAMQTLSAEEQLVLKWLFLQPKKGNVERLCQELCVEQSTVYRRRDKALTHFTTALYGI